MSELVLTPDAEKVVADYLRDREEILEITDERRVGSRTPDSTRKPWVTYQLINKPTVGASRTEHLIRAHIQFDCYAGQEGGKPEANLLTRTVRAALVAMPLVEHEEAVVTGVEIIGDTRLPDVRLDSRERYVLGAYVWMHRRPS